MKIKKYILFFLLLPLTLQVHTLVFKFKYTKGEKYRTVTTVSEKIYLNGEFNNSAINWNKIAIEVLDVKNGKGLLSGKYQVSTIARSEYQIKHLDEDFSSMYWIDETGNYESLDPNYLMPFIRDIPFFSKKDIKTGEKWKAIGTEVHDFRRYGVGTPIFVPVDIEYQFIKEETKNGKKVALLKLNYMIYRELKELLGLSGWYPINIIGKVESAIYWDIRKGRIFSYEDNYHKLYTFNTGETYEFIGTSSAEVIEVEEMDKKKVEEEIKKVIEEEKIKDTFVSSDNEGVTITLENINFQPESDILMPSEQKKLKKIAEILKKYPERDILITGHTALWGTEEGRQILSDKRAKATGEYLSLIGIKNSMIFKGYGAKIPIADNSTKEGMKRNRRVEIKILEN